MSHAAVPLGAAGALLMLTVGGLGPGGDGVARATHGLQTGPFAEGACGRFFAYLVNGGVGKQAIRLLPTHMTLKDGSRLIF